MADDAILSDAIAWRIRLRDEHPDDWEAFASWLEGDSRRAAAYDQAALAEDDLAPAFAALPAPPVVANDDDALASPVRRWKAGAVAAVAALLVGAVTLPTLNRPETYIVATVPGERRSVDLGGGSHIALNGATRLTLRHGDSRFARLDSGEASFIIRHDAANPFVLEAGDDRIRDVGTVFNVARDPATLRIEVAEGSVLYNPEGEAVSLKAGQALRVASREGRMVVAQIDPGQVAGWRAGRLSYRAAPLADVGADLGRALGVAVSVDPALAGRPFTGVIRVDRNQPALFHRLGLLLDVEATQKGDGWILAPHHRASR